MGSIKNDIERIEAQLNELKKSEVESLSKKKLKAWFKPKPTQLEKKIASTRNQLIKKAYRVVLK